MAKRPPAQAGVIGVRAHFEDALAVLDAQVEASDPPADEPRGGHGPGQWPGAPASRLPPDCPVTPLGLDGKVCYFIDSMGQLIPVAASEWGKKILIQLFALRPNYLYWAWPRFNAKTFSINGLEADDAVQALTKACAQRGLFSTMDRVRGRGAWTLGDGSLIWHAGDAIFRVDRGKLAALRPCEIEGVFYPQRPPVTHPWMSPVSAQDGPALDLLDVLRTWQWERKRLDPYLTLGWIAGALLGAALAWRPTLFTVGDKGTGKSSLHDLIKALLGPSLHSAADTTAAGIYQRVRQDCLPVAIDELEADADNRRVTAVVNLARLAASGAMMYRGGAEHEGVEFRLQNSFFFSAINAPPLKPQDRSRMAIVSLRELPPDARMRDLKIPANDVGRMLLRQLMDSWGDFPRLLADWKGALQQAGLSKRAQDTFGVPLALCNLLIGDEAMEAAGFDMEDMAGLGRHVARMTAADRDEQGTNWIDCLNHLMGATIDGFSGGQRQTVGQVLEYWEKADPLDAVNDKLATVGLKAKEEDIVDAQGRRTGDMRRLLCGPLSSPQLRKLFSGSTWPDGVWAGALKQAPHDVVIRDRGNGQNVKINRMATRCLLVDMAAYDRCVDAIEKGGAPP